MKRRLLILVILLVLFSSVFFLLRRQGRQKLPKITVKASEGLKSRRMKVAREVASMHLSTEAYEFLLSGDTLFYIPYKNEKVSYLLYADRHTVSIKNDGSYSISVIQNENGIIWLYDGNRKQLLSYRKGSLTDSISLKGNAWRAFVRGEKAIYITEAENAPDYFYSLDLRTKKHIDSVPVSQVFGLPNDNNLGMKTSGNFFGIPGTAQVGYQPTKASFSVFFDLNNLSAFKVHQSIDSLPFPQIIDEQVMEGMTRKKPVPELYINTAATAAPNAVFLLSGLNGDSARPGNIIDVYSFPTWQYQHSYNLNDGERQVQNIFFQPGDNVLWVLYDDRLSLLGYKPENISYGQNR